MIQEKEALVQKAIQSDSLKINKIKSMQSRRDIKALQSRSASNTRIFHRTITTSQQKYPY